MAKTDPQWLATLWLAGLTCADCTTDSLRAMDEPSVEVGEVVVARCDRCQELRRHVVQSVATQYWTHQQRAAINLAEITTVNELCRHGRRRQQVKYNLPRSGSPLRDSGSEVDNDRYEVCCDCGANGSGLLKPLLVARGGDHVLTPSGRNRAPKESIRAELTHRAELGLGSLRWRLG